MPRTTGRHHGGKGDYGIPGCDGNLQSYWTTTRVWKLTVVLDYYEGMETYVVLHYYEAMETYSRIALLRSCGNLRRIGLIRSYGNLQSYWTTTKLWKLTSYCTTTRLWKLTVVLDYDEAMETYSRIGPLRSYGNLQSYWTTAKLWKLKVVLNYYSPILLVRYNVVHYLHEASAEHGLKPQTSGASRYDLCDELIQVHK
jgi:hypothetical protein